MKIRDEILINQYAQGLISECKIIDSFNQLSLLEKRKYLRKIVEYFIQQSKPTNDDIKSAIIMSTLRPTYTPCVMLRKGVATSNLLVIADLPENELEKVLRLFLALFKISYLRRFQIEKDDPDKWWYWDLSDQNKVKRVLEMHDFIG